jgi:uncharacterized protein (TIGR00161 family)
MEVQHFRPPWMDSFTDDIEIREYTTEDLSNAMVIVAFPTIGLVGYLAGNFIVNALKMKEIGAILSDRFIPAAIIHESTPSPPVRIYNAAHTCGPNGSCKNIIVIISEFMPDYESIKPLVNAIFKWVETKGSNIIVALEGTRMIDENETEGKNKVYGIGSTPDMKKILEDCQIQQTKEGMITGVTGVLLYDGTLKNKNVLCLLSESDPALPDARAAGILIEKIDNLIPGLKVNAQPLFQQAEEIENSIRRFIEQSEPAMVTRSTMNPSMYG